MDYMGLWSEDLKDVQVTRHEGGSVSYYHPRDAYLLIGRWARVKAEEEFEKRAGKQWKKNQEAIRTHRDYNLNNLVINT